MAIYEGNGTDTVTLTALHGHKVPAGSQITYSISLGASGKALG